jgi:hypothetical protein
LEFGKLGLMMFAQIVDILPSCQLHSIDTMPTLHTKGGLYTKGPRWEAKTFKLIPKILSNQIWVAGHFVEPLTYPYFILFPKIISSKGSFHSYKLELWAKSYATFSLEISNCPSILFGAVPCGIMPCVAIFPYAAMILSSLHLVIFGHPYLIHMKFKLGNFWCYEFNTSFLSHLPFRFALEEKNLAFKLWEDSLE